MSFKNTKSTSIQDRCMRGGAVLAIAAAIERGLRFVVNMILARLLVPEQFGLMALVIAANGLLEVLTEVGVRQSVIQNKNGDTASFLNVAWWFSSARGLLLGGVSFVIAPYLAQFYEEPMLTTLLRVAFLTNVFNGFTNPGLFVLEKRLQFKRYVFIRQGTAIVGTLVSLAMALWVPNVWALVAGFVIGSGLRCVSSFLFCSFEFEMRIDRESWNELFRFCRGMLGLPILTFLFLHADIFSLGKICSKELLGLYSMAMALATVASIMFNQVAGPMILPVLADAQDDVSMVRDRLLRMTRLLFLFGLPMVVCQIVYAKPILTLVYGPKYTQVSTAFSVLTVYAVLSMATVLVASTFMALGRPEVHRSFTIVRLISLSVILYPMIRGFEASGAAIARVCCMLLAGIIQQYSLSRLIALPIRQYLMTLRQGAVLAVLVLIPALALRVWVVRPGFQVLVAMGLCGTSWGYILWTKRGLIRYFVSDTNLAAETSKL